MAMFFYIIAAYGFAKVAADRGNFWQVYACVLTVGAGFHIASHLAGSFA